MYDVKGALTKTGYLSKIFELGFIVFASFMIGITSSNTYPMDSQEGLTQDYYALTDEEGTTLYIKKIQMENAQTVGQLCMSIR